VLLSGVRYFRSQTPPLFVWLKIDNAAAPPPLHVQGGHEFFTDLTSALRTIHLFSKSKQFPYTFDFARLKSYHGTESTGVGTWRLRSRAPAGVVLAPTLLLLCVVACLSVTIGLEGIDMAALRGRDVILVEDIVDTGTLGPWSLGCFWAAAGTPLCSVDAVFP
jgi:hypothetical protein